MKTGRKVATAEEFSVAKEENLVANATNTVAMSSPVKEHAGEILSFKSSI